MIAQNMVTNFNLIERLKFSNYFKSFWERCKQQKQKRQLLEKAQERLDKELDLQKFLSRIRSTMIATMGILTPSQRLLVREMRHIVINEGQSSTEQEPSSYDEENKPIERNFLQEAVLKIAKSKNKTDMRFIDLYRTSQAKRYGVISNDFRDIIHEDAIDLQSSQTVVENDYSSNLSDSQSQVINDASSS